MAWVKLDDSMPHHPKIIAAGPEAFALDVAAICYSNRFGTDGHIAKHLLPHLLPGLQNVEHFASILLHVGRWIETENGYLIDGYGNHWIRFVGNRERVPRWMRAQMLEEMPECVACGSVDDLQADHIIPLALGGKTEPDNLQTLCGICNRSKGAKHPDLWGGVN